MCRQLRRLLSKAPKPERRINWKNGKLNEIDAGFIQTLYKGLLGPRIIDHQGAATIEYFCTGRAEAAWELGGPA